jgi:urease accessory protein
MLNRMSKLLCRAALLLAAGISLAHAHHAMDYALPATALEGLLSGFGHPVIGIDHLLFIVGTGVLAAGLNRGMLLPLFFVVASISAAGWRTAGAPLELGEIWIALTLVILGVILVIARNPGRAETASFFLACGALHGYALAEAIVGAERTPLLAYFAGLTVIQSAIALTAWWIATRLAARYPRVLLQRVVGAAVGIAGLAFAGMAAFS